MIGGWEASLTAGDCGRPRKMADSSSSGGGIANRDSPRAARRARVFFVAVS